MIKIRRKFLRILFYGNLKRCFDRLSMTLLIITVFLWLCQTEPFKVFMIKTDN